MMTKISDYYNPRNINSTSIYSPVTLNQEWPAGVRLLFVLLCSCLGSALNGFFVSSFFVERALKNAGYVFLICIGITDLSVTTGIMFISAVVILGGWDMLFVCQWLQFIGLCSAYCYSTFFALIACENYLRASRKQHKYASFLSLGVGCISLIVFVHCLLLTTMGIYLDLDYDYCQRLSYGNTFFKRTSFIFFHGIPFLITIIGLVSASIEIKRQKQNQTQNEHDNIDSEDLFTTNINIAVYLLYVFTWIPCLVIIHKYPSTTDQNYYYSVWLALFRSIFSNCLYGFINENFRGYFLKIFCCMTTVISTNEEPMKPNDEPDEVMIHVMHQANNKRSTQRTAASQRET